MERKKPSLAIFDVDGTLMPDNPDEISGRAFWELNKRGVFTSSDETLETLATLRDEYASCPNFERQNYLTPMIIEFDDQMRNKPVKTIKKFAEEQAESDIEQLLYGELIDEIEYQHDQGAALGIISGSPDVFIQALKRRLDFDYATGTRHFHNRKEYCSIRGVRSRAKEKHLIAEQWRHKLSSEIGKEAIISSAYGDTMNDFTLLQEAHDPVAVNPKPDLAVEAIRRNYRLIQTQQANVHVNS